MITHFLDLDVCTNGIHKEMRFLITDIGHEEVLLGYPWLATFEPRFNWKSAVIDKCILPIVISSINPHAIRNWPIIATALSEETKQSIVRQLESECTIWGISTNLTIQAKEQQVDAEVPKEYHEFTRLFNKEATNHFPPSREWDHAINLKPGAPDTLNCKVYPMTRDEDTTLEKFLDEMVAKGYCIYDPLNPPTPCHSSLSRRKTGNYNQCKITGGLTATWCKINTHSPS
jgi:hypothetical protein